MELSSYTVVKVMNQSNIQVNQFLSNAVKWKEELKMIRRLLNETDLKEEFKWYAPCYTYNNANVAILGGFKDYFVLSFFKGALLKDSMNILLKPGENTQSARIIKMHSLEEVMNLTSTIKEYVIEAIEIEKAGLKVDFDRHSKLNYPEELSKKLEESSNLKIAFENLTPGRQNAYILFFSGAKQSSTRLSRIEKYEQKILSGLGFYD